MAKDPAFLFYPGDYLRDTQCLSEKSQVAYDRIMCEHMRNICISQEQLNFFTKRLNEDEKIEVFSLLTKIRGGFQIHWVAESIAKRRLYSESRRKNRDGKTKNICNTYVSHMENEIENENKDEFKGGTGGKLVEFTIEHCLVVAMNDDRWVNANKCTREELEKFNEMLSGKGRYQCNPKEYKEYFYNWKKSGKNATTKQSIGETIDFD